MRRRSALTVRLAVLPISIALSVLVSAACTDKSSVGNNAGEVSVLLPQSADRKLDILFVVDNSPSMIHENEFCLTPVDFFMGVLQWARGLDLHVGVVSTDLGAGGHQVPGCETVGGDNGVLGQFNGIDRGSSCIAPGQRYIVDVEPVGCSISRTDSGSCTSDDCTQAHCDAAAQGGEVLTYAQDQFGCPRCRNFTGNAASAGESAFCLATGLGSTDGCGFVQPLEAMYRALDNNPQNAGFLRNDAQLAVVFITDSDDCSASDPNLFDPSQDSLASPLGYLSRFRCFEFGVTCDINDREHIGPRLGCQPRTDAAAMLHPISRYVQFLRGLGKEPEIIAVGALAGPVNDEVIVTRDSFDRPQVQSACTEATPSVRLQAFVEELSPAETSRYQSICGDCSTRFHQIGQDLHDGLHWHQCLSAPLDGCSDVGSEFGIPQAPNSCAANSRCLPQCEVTDIRARGTPGETRTDLPSCLQVMPDGQIEPSNIDRSRAYAAGHPAIRDPSLPVSACWHVAFHPDCQSSNYSQLLIARRSDPPPGTFAEVSCVRLADEATACDDGIDNDQDCLTDRDDPDC